MSIMKKVILLAAIALSCILATSPANAKIWRLNNTGIQADFTTVQAAHDNILVQPGDTLHLEPSPTSYGNLSGMSKRLTIISTGNFLAENPGTQFSNNAGFMNYVTFANTGTATGSVFHCNMTYMTLHYADSVRIERSSISSVTGLDIGQNSDNNIIINNYISNLSVGASKNTLIANNIFQAHLTTTNQSSSTIINNILQATSTNSTSITIQNAIFRNNIINKSRPYNFTNCTVENNISFNTAFPAGGGNQTGISMATIFVDPNSTVDNGFVLQTAIANPAKGAGVNGVDCGAFGGSTPFKLALQPAIPAIYNMVIPATVSGNTMNITFSTRSNN
jgi:hypothetical protein